MEAGDLIEPYYYDYWGKRVETSESTRRTLIAAITLRCHPEERAERASRRTEERPQGASRCHPEERPQGASRCHPEERPQGASRRTPVIVAREGRAPILPSADEHGRVQLEDGSEYGGDLAELPLGYHTWYSATSNEPCPLIVCPPRCYLPGEMRRGKIWALSTQLYALRSERNWGIGDFTDLRRFAEIAANAGARAVGLNPLHELHLHNPRAASPYSPSSRLFLNAFYIDVERVPELHENPGVRSLIGSDAFQHGLAIARSETFVDYAGVSRAKFFILEELYRVFSEHHLGRDDARGHAFEKFVKAGGSALERLAIYEALAEHFFSSEPARYGWQQWPVEYRTPESPKVARFALEHRQRVNFFLYVQWIAEEQLREAAAEICRAKAWLYLDLAVGADLNGAEVWSDQDAFVVDASLGAPADPLNTEGQNWGLASFSPLALRERAYRPFVELLRANMRHAGILRIDHVMALRRAFCIPRGGAASSGAYVRYPFDEMLGILALESIRNECAVVGEDLGTLPEGFRERMASAGALSTRLFYFQRSRSDGSFLAPPQYPRLSAVSIGTHDLPTLAGWWTGDRSIDEDRAADRFRLIDALERAGAIDADGARRLREDAANGGTLAVVDELSAASYRFLGTTSSMLVVVAIEDVLGEAVGVNVPGTFDEHPNWRRKRSLSLEEMDASGGLMRIGKVLTDR